MSQPDPKPPKRIVDSDAMKAKLESDPRCRSCRERATDPHHVVLKSQRGDDVEDNIVPLCHTHHREYHDGRGFIHLTIPETSYVLTKLGLDAGQEYAAHRRLVLDSKYRGHEASK
jgi:hypothetical protein